MMNEDLDINISRKKWTTYERENPGNEGTPPDI